MPPSGATPAASVGLSDVGLARACKRLGITRTNVPRPCRSLHALVGVLEASGFGQKRAPEPLGTLHPNSVDQHYQGPQKRGVVVPGPAHQTSRPLQHV